MSKIQKFKQKLQAIAPDDVIIKYMGKIDGHLYYLVDYIEYAGLIGHPQVLEIDPQDEEYVRVNCGDGLFEKLCRRFPGPFK